MTSNESDSVDDDLLSALKEDGLSSAPKGARSRVLARLGVGVAAGVAAGTQATAASASAAKVATSSAAPVAGGAAGLGLVKVLVAHPLLGVIATLAVGSGVGIGAYRTLEPAPVSTPAVTMPRAPTTAGKVSMPLAAPKDTTHSEEPRVTERPAESGVSARAAASPARLRENVPAPTLSPAPDLPENVGTARLSEQQALLDQARSSLRRGDGAAALAIAGEHERRYPATDFAEEREAIEILALVMLGRSDEARSRGERFERRFPASLFLPSIRGSLEPSDVRSDPPSRD